VLTNSKWGYYATQAASRVLGSRGDFTTAPEISPMFGDVVGLWVADNWVRLGKPSKFRLVELGPGKGTLMNDMLHV
jgi:NADH dehydrogenase [ubiquinone] 1 alpha subcomplex assembly factor 7